HRIVKLKNGKDECKEHARGHGMAFDLGTTHPQKGSRGDHADDVHERRTDGLGRYRLKVGAEESFGGSTKAQAFPGLHGESFDNPVARNRLMEDVLDVGQLVLSLARRLANAAADPACRENYEWNKQQ